MKVREGRLRRVLARRGLALARSRRRDPGALDYGRYVISRDGQPVHEAAGLDDAEQWIAALDLTRPGGDLEPLPPPLLDWAASLAGEIHLVQCEDGAACPRWADPGHEHRRFYRARAESIVRQLEPRIGIANVLAAVSVVLEELW
ncbi:MAG TPA: hypothetical protein VNH17_02080 [Streptosporangiaceae bacterium]|nr:hypothetical protein [Streptosporangiaceae bacterium]